MFRRKKRRRDGDGRLATARESSESASIPRKRATVLAVDDDPLNLDVMREILEDDYELLTATSGQEALDLATSRLPDIVLLDIMMPGMDGYETCRRIRANQETRHIKIVLVSAKAATSDRLAGYEAGADDYIHKPFEEEEILAKIRIFLRLKSVDELENMKSELLDLVAHEIRTPLTGISPAAEMLLVDEEVSKADRVMWAGMIDESAKRLVTLTDRALLLSRLRTGDIDLESRPVDLGATFREVVARDARATVELMLEPKPPVVVDGDERLLSLALECILDGLQTSESCEAAAPVVYVSVAGRRVAIEVTSDAGGPEPMEGSGIFRSFAAKKAGDQTVGAGLEMALARAILRAHGGDITIGCAPDAALTLSGWLPLRGPAS